MAWHEHEHGMARAGVAGACNGVCMYVEVNSARRDGPFTGRMFKAELREERAFQTRIDVMKLMVTGIHEMYVLTM